MLGHVIGAIGAFVVIVGGVMLVELIRRRIIKGRYQERLNEIVGLFEDRTVRSRIILNRVADLRVYNDNKDLKAVATLLKYRMRTRAYIRFLKFYKP